MLELSFDAIIGCPTTEELGEAFRLETEVYQFKSEE